MRARFVAGTGATAEMLRHWIETLVWLGWQLLLGLAPIWVGAGTFLAVREGSQIGSLFTEGQLALYAAAVTATALHLASWDRDPPGMRFRPGLILFSVLIVLASVSLYVAVQTLRATSELPLADAFVVLVSGAAFVAAVVVASVASAVDSQRLLEQVPEERVQQTDDLERQMRDLDA